MKDVENFLLENLKTGDTVIVATSGGPDSMALTHILSNNSLNLKIVVAHVNHNVRKQSKEEYLYVENYCFKNNLIFEGMEITCKFDSNFEDEARKARMTFFEMLRQKYHAKYIITAHHGDDLVESVLMRITRGSNLSGYAGLKLKDNHFLKPLLFVTKNDLINYCNIHKIKYYVDKTNNQNIHTRNRYRHKVLPFLKRENPIIHKKYLQFSMLLCEYDNFVNDYILKEKLIENNCIDLNKLQSYPQFIHKIAVELLIKEIQKNHRFNIQNKNIENILKAMQSKKSNLTIDLENDFKFIKAYNIVTIQKIDNCNLEKIEFNDFYEDENFIIKKISDLKTKSNNIIRLDSKEVKLPLYIRHKEDKDVMFVKNLGHKKVKDIFIDCKVSMQQRKSYPLLVDSQNNILWIPGLKKSQFDKEKEEKYDIILSSERKK